MYRQYQQELRESVRRFVDISLRLPVIYLQRKVMFASLYISNRLEVNMTQIFSWTLKFEHILTAPCDVKHLKISKLVLSNCSNSISTKI